MTTQGQFGNSRPIHKTNSTIQIKILLLNSSYLGDGYPGEPVTINITVNCICKWILVQLCLFKADSISYLHTALFTDAIKPADDLADNAEISRAGVT